MYLLILPIIVISVSLVLLYLIIIKKFNREQTYLALALVILFLPLGILVLKSAILDIFDIKNSNYQTIRGKCEITEFKSSGRTGIHEIHITFGELIIFGDYSKYGYLEEGFYYCDASYLESSKTIHSIDIKDIND